jgi:hypothetical protein
VENLITEDAGSFETGINRSGPLKPRVAVTWQEGEFPQNPHQYFAISGWHAFRGCGNWDVETMVKEVSAHVQFSECESTTDLSQAVEERWQGFTFSPREGVIVLSALFLCSIGPIWLCRRPICLLLFSLL